MTKENNQNKEIEHLQSKYAIDEHFSKKETLSDKIFDSKLVLGDDISKIFAKHVKEKIQNAQRELKDKKNMKFSEGRAYIGVWWIDKIFKDCFGEELL